MKTGEKLGSFTIESQLGEGAMGVVYKAVHDKTGKVAAVKVMSNEVSVKGNADERFEREGEILKQFRHPNIVRFLAYGRYQKRTYLAMEFVEGTTLDDVLERKGPIAWRKALDLGVQLAEALHYAHQKGVVHRDLKPSNLMITKDGQLKLTDFGIAKDLDATALTGTGRTLGTAAYMAPEQIRGTPSVSHKTDLYAFGVVLYQMLTGQTPFQGKSAMVLMHAHLTEAPPRVSSKVPDVPRALDDLIHKMLAKEPSDRPWDAADVSHRLSEIAKLAAAGKAKPVFQAPANPSRAGMPMTEADGPGRSMSGPQTEGATSTSARKSKKKKTRPATLEVQDETRSPLFWAGTAGLGAALVALLAFTAYMLFWPISEQELMRRAGTLMESTEPARWKEARDDYFADIEKRFPQHAEQVREWRDKIDLEQLKRRANVLEKPNLLASSQPANDAESQYVATFTAASSAIKDGDLPGAWQTWKDCAELYTNSRGEADRLWAKIAADKAASLEVSIKNDRETGIRMLAEVKGAELNGKANQAALIRRQIVERYGKFKHMLDLVAEAQSAPPPEDER